MHIGLRKLDYFKLFNVFIGLYRRPTTRTKERKNNRRAKSHFLTTSKSMLIRNGQRTFDLLTFNGIGFQHRHMKLFVICLLLEVFVELFNVVSNTKRNSLFATAGHPAGWVKRAMEMDELEGLTLEVRVTGVRIMMRDPFVSLHPSLMHEWE